MALHDFDQAKNDDALTDPLLGERHIQVDPSAVNATSNIVRNPAMHIPKSTRSATTVEEGEPDERSASVEEEVPIFGSESGLMATRYFDDNNTSVSRNVTLTLWFTGLAMAGQSIWSQSVLAAFVYFLRSKNPESVGFITAVMGAAQLVASFPTGIAVDSYRRDVFLRLSAAVGLLAIIFIVLACKYLNYAYLVTGLAVWGLCWGVANTANFALFADSVPLGQRSYYFTQRSILVMLGNAVGPACALIMFSLLGGHWTVHDCAAVILIGQAVCFPAVALLCFFRDEDATPLQQNQQQSAPVLSSAEAEEEFQIDYNPGHTSEQGSTDPTPLLASPGGGSTRTAVGDVTASTHPVMTWNAFLVARRIPVMIALGDFLAGLGSGMSIRFFPIFFVENLHLGPIVVQALYVAFTLLLTVLMHANQILAKQPRWGRCRVTVVAKWTGIALTYLMVFTYWVGGPRWIVLVLFVFRMAFTNSTSALTRSLMMDHVPKQERGKWSALESVNMFSWSGSAALGGFLVERVGIARLFLVTGAIQFAATGFIMPLFGDDKPEGT